MTQGIGFFFQLWALTSHKMFGWKWGIVTYKMGIQATSRLCRIVVRGQGKNAKVYANIPDTINGGEWRRVAERDVILMYPKLR
jgi:hypothetical protein